MAVLQGRCMAWIFQYVSCKVGKLAQGVSSDSVLWGCSYRQSVASHMSDSEFATLKTFRLPGKVLFLRSLKFERRQACVSSSFLLLFQRPSAQSHSGCRLQLSYAMLPEALRRPVEGAREPTTL